MDRLANLTNEYLQFSRLPKINSRPHDLVKMLYEIKSFMEKELVERKIDLTLQIPDKEILIKMDYDQIRRVFLNLIKNSMESINQGGKINISIEEKLDALHILFSDNGHGINKSLQGKIFEPFFTSKKLGTGLGLAISKQIIEDHNGSITYVDSKNGASFLVILNATN